MDLGGGGAGGFGAATSVTFNSLNRGVILSHLHMWIMRDMPFFFLDGQWRHVCLTVRFPNCGHSLGPTTPALPIYSRVYHLGRGLMAVVIVSRCQ